MLLAYGCLIFSASFVLGFLFLFFSHFLAAQLCFRILVPQPGIELMSPAVKVWNPNHWTAREVPLIFVFDGQTVLSLSSGDPIKLVPVSF